jgi:DNA-binding XRE family transcriptional regulator
MGSKAGVETLQETALAFSFAYLYFSHKANFIQYKISRLAKKAGYVYAFIRREGAAMTLGERVVMWRKRRKMTQKDLATKARLNPISLSKIERGVSTDLDASTVCRLAQALNVKTDYLFGLIGEEDAEADYHLVRA